MEFRALGRRIAYAVTQVMSANRWKKCNYRKKYTSKNIHHSIWEIRKTAYFTVCSDTIIVPIYLLFISNYRIRYNNKCNLLHNALNFILILLYDTWIIILVWILTCVYFCTYKRLQEWGLNFPTDVFLCEILQVAIMLYIIKHFSSVSIRDILRKRALRRGL